MKLAASSMLPEPLYLAVCGYGQSGRVRTALPWTRRAAGIRSGAAPHSTHCSAAVSISNVLAPTPPPQWNMPGTMKRRKKPVVEAPMRASTLS